MRVLSARLYVCMHARRCFQILGHGCMWPHLVCVPGCLTVCRCSQIMGRAETDDMSAAQIFYPCMQCADIFFLKADICQLGMDQRKV